VTALRFVTSAGGAALALALSCARHSSSGHGEKGADAQGLTHAHHGGTAEQGSADSRDARLDERDAAAATPKGPPIGSTVDGGDDVLFAEEVRARSEYWLTPIAVRGRLISQSGEPLAHATLSLSGRTTSSDAQGEFAFPDLQRMNGTIAIEADGYKSELIFVHLERSVREANVVLDPIVLVKDEPNVVRFLFGGDTSFGRRFLDPAEQAGHLEIPPSNPKALIDSANPAPGTRAALSFVAPLFQSAEFATVNLETPVTGTPKEYHRTKAYVFFTLPESLSVFAWLGVHYVNMGNNHVFDYLTDGMRDTLANLDEYGLAHSGAGLDVADAFVPYHETLGASDYSFMSMTSVTGVENPPLYVAGLDPLTGEEKGGAADLTDTERVAKAISTERALGYLPIVQEHGGAEYTYWPTEHARASMSLAIQSGAALVVSHHPHVAQGFAFEDGHLIVEGLGNLCFDQARHETMLGLMARIDLDGEQVVEARGIPVYLEDFRPRPITGDLASHLLHRIGERSEAASVSIENGKARVVPAEPAATDSVSRSQRLELDVDSSGQTIVDLRSRFVAEESLLEARVAANSASNVALQAGEDILIYGDFEDWDVDDDYFESKRWDVTGPASYPCLHDPYRGAAALCLYRESKNKSVSVVAFRNRVRVLGEAIEKPQKDLSFVGYVRGDNAGSAEIEMRYYASEGSREFGSETVWQHAPGTYSWGMFTHDLVMPADVPDEDPVTYSAHALRFFVTHEPPQGDAGILRLDDLAIVSWRDRAESLSLADPNPIQFLRLFAPAGHYTLELVTGRIRVRH
jgi:poly-gamma-glutamate capsule biosynthesis protein CapA/YwtB (metallophosphatase superfamily)